jgi:hypothetical protein
VCLLTLFLSHDLQCPMLVPFFCHPSIVQRKTLQQAARWLAMHLDIYLRNPPAWERFRRCSAQSIIPHCLNGNTFHWCWRSISCMQHSGRNLAGPSRVNPRLRMSFLAFWPRRSNEEVIFPHLQTLPSWMHDIFASRIKPKAENGLGSVHFALFRKLSICTAR